MPISSIQKSKNPILAWQCVPRPGTEGTSLWPYLTSAGHSLAFPAVRSSAFLALNLLFWRLFKKCLSLFPCLYPGDKRICETYGAYI